MIFFNGRSSDDLHVIVEQYPARPVPQRKAEKFQIPGRSGDVVITQDAWENVERRYQVYISAEGPKLPIVAAEVFKWLMVPGYHQLADDYDLDTFTMAQFVGPVDVQNIDNDFGRFELVFDCWPQRFLNLGAMASPVARNSALINPGIYTAEPLIVVTGAGPGALTVGQYTINLTDCNGVTIDSRDKEVYRGATNLNASASGSFPLLDPGSNVISWTGGIQSVTITPRWFVI